MSGASYEWDPFIFIEFTRDQDIELVCLIERFGNNPPSSIGDPALLQIHNLRQLQTQLEVWGSNIHVFLLLLAETMFE